MFIKKNCTKVSLKFCLLLSPIKTYHYKKHRLKLKQWYHQQFRFCRMLLGQPIILRRLERLLRPFTIYIQTNYFRLAIIGYCIVAILNIAKNWFPYYEILHLGFNTPGYVIYFLQTLLFLWILHLMASLQNQTP